MQIEINKDANTVIEETMSNTDAENLSDVIIGIHDQLNIWAGQLSDLNKENKRLKDAMGHKCTNDAIDYVLDILDNWLDINGCPLHMYQYADPDECNCSEQAKVSSVSSWLKTIKN